MAILTKIDGIPLFSDVKEAVKWAKLKRLRGYHIHYWQGQKGYMGGSKHMQAVDPKTKKQVNIEATPEPTQYSRPSQPAQSSPPSTPTYNPPENTGGGY